MRNGNKSKYLESILFVLKEYPQGISAKTIAKKLGIAKPEVCKAVSQCINVAEDDNGNFLFVNWSKNDW